MKEEGAAYAPAAISFLTVRKAARVRIYSVGIGGAEGSHTCGQVRGQAVLQARALSRSRMRTSAGEAPGSLEKKRAEASRLMVGRGKPRHRTGHICCGWIAA